MDSKREKGYFLILLAALVNSTPEVVVKGISGAFAPMQLCCLRVLSGALFLLPFAIRDCKKHGIDLNIKNLRLFLVLGFVLVPIHMSLQQLAVVHIDASAVAALLSGNPVFTVFLAHFLLREPLKKRHITAITFQLLGVYLIVDPFNAGLQLRGFVEALVSAFFLSLMAVLNRPATKRFGGLATGCFNLLFGGVEMLIILILGNAPFIASLFGTAGLGVFSNVSLLSGFSKQTIIPFLYAGVVCAGCGFVLITKVIEYTSATESSFIYLLKPILAAVFAVFLLKENISLNRASGIACSVMASLCVMVPALIEMQASAKE